LGRVEMHPEAGGSVDLKHSTTVLGNGRGEIVGHNIDAADIESYDTGYALAHENVGRMHVVGYVRGGTAGAEVGCGLEPKLLVIGKDSVEGVAVLLENIVCKVIDLDRGEYLFVTVATTR